MIKILTNDVDSMFGVTQLQVHHNQARFINLGETNLRTYCLVCLCVLRVYA